MENGIILMMFQRMITVLEKFNLVEYMKRLAGDGKSRLAVDYYIILKWIVVIVSIYLLSINFCHPMILTVIVSYFLFYNTFTYLKYHSIPIFKKNNQNSITRRIILVFQAFLFMVICYVFYYLLYSNSFDWSQLESLVQGALVQSFSTSFVSTNTSNFPPVDFKGNVIIISQMMHAYLYIGILIAQTFVKE